MTTAAQGEESPRSLYQPIKMVLRALAIVFLTVVGGCCLIIVKNAQPVNPIRAVTSETDFVRSGGKTDHIRVVEDKVVGSGRFIKGVDHTRLHVIGRYQGGEVFDDGVLTYQILWPPMRIPFLPALEGMRVGSVRRVIVDVSMLAVDWQQPSRFIVFANPKQDDDSFRFRLDKGNVEFEIEVLDSCRPYEYEIVQNAVVHLSPYLGCW